MNKQKFETLFKNLTTSQRKAVETVEGPVMVIAGPGTGKTTILTLRIAHILKTTDTPASGILAITYTNAGVKAMRLKLRELIGREADHVGIYTFHSFAKAVIDEFTDHFPHIAYREQLTDIEAGAIVGEILERKDFKGLRPLGKPDMYIGPILGVISSAKQEGFDAKSLRSFAKEAIDMVHADETSYSTRGKTKGQLKGEAKKQLERLEKTFLLADIFELYEAKKKELQKIDFNDLIFELQRALREDELLRTILQERFLYILVDEHQDTNGSQNEIIRTLADFFDTPNVFVVGDEKQAIYRFQGASVENFLSLESIWSDVEVIQLQENFRSTQHILDAGFSTIENNYSEGEHAQLRVELKAARETDTMPIDHTIYQNQQDAEGALVANVEKLLAKDDTSTVAVIVRKNAEVERVTRLLETYGLEVASERVLNIFTHPAGVLFFDLLRSTIDPSHRESLARVLLAGLWDVELADALQHVRDLRSGRIDEVLKKIPVIAETRSQIKEHSPLQFLYNLAEVSGYKKWLATDPAAIEVWRGVLVLAENILQGKGVSDVTVLLEGFEEYHSTHVGGRNITVKMGAPEARLRVLTAHSSKGLEFDYVFIPYTTEKSWLPRTRGSYFGVPEVMKDRGDEKDARRLFYVALTRARKHVVLSSFEKGSDASVETPLRFIDEIHDDLVTTTHAEAHAGLKNLQKKNVAFTPHEKVLQKYTQERLLDKGLSVTALNHFIECPSKFLVVSILALPQAPHPAAEKGTILHLAIARAWQLQNKTPEAIEKIIVDTVREQLVRSFLSPVEQASIEEDLIGDSKALVNELVAHMHGRHDVLVEHASRFTQEVDDIELPLHGKLDAVVTHEKSVAVFDYKTKRAMSENAIRGETKNDDGNYFRQLIFYKLLLQNDSRFSDKAIEPSLMFVVPDDKGMCKTVTLPIEESDVERVKGEISQLVTSVWSGDMLRTTCNDEKCEYCMTVANIKKSQLG